MGKKIFGYIQEIQQNLEEMESIQKMHISEDVLVAFRGEPQDYGETKLVPSLFRNAEMVHKEHYGFELMSDYSLLNLDKSRFIEKAIESQHYVAISRMLDITFSILPALYFACGSEKNMKKDGILYVFCFPEYYSPHSAYLEEFYKNMLEDKMNVAYSRNFKVITHCYSNERIEAQSGGFIFFPGKTYIPINPIYYKQIIIKADDKKEICSDLKKLFNIEEATLFPEKSTRAKLVRTMLESKKYIKRELSVQNEISTSFDRILFETEVQKRTGLIPKKEILRKLRKEKDDLLEYVKATDITNEEEVELIERIEDTFVILTKI